MRKYDFAKARALIAERKPKRASLGMREDWFWTGTRIYEDGKFCDDFKDGEPIAGIRGSRWATPALMLIYEDEREEMVSCYTGDSDAERPTSGLGSAVCMGDLSGPAQQRIDAMELRDG